MKKRNLLLLTLILAVSACNKGASSNNDESDKYYANFMLNYRSVEIETPSGNTGSADNLLYVQKEIEVGKPFTAPENDPVRESYNFVGWYKESACENIWNFETDVSAGNVILYAGWGVAASGDFEEPEYSYPDEIITDANFRLNGVLNMPVSNGKVSLSTGAINRLVANKDDVTFALNYAHKENVSVSSAKYDVDAKTIAVSTSGGDAISVQVQDNTLALSLATESSTYEAKAAAYEEAGANYENYHIMLAGSSSMEYWTTSKKDLNPIVSYNHGIGGTTVNQWTNKLLERLVFPYSPKAVVFYVGVNNIINTGNDGDATGAMLESLFNKTHEHLPNTHVFYVLINKLPGYLSYQDEFDKANKIAIDYSSDKSWIECIDAGAPLLKENGKPNSAYFRTDGLHMSQYGYVLWGAEIKKALINWMS